MQVPGSEVKSWLVRTTHLLLGVFRRAKGFAHRSPCSFPDATVFYSADPALKQWELLQASHPDPLESGIEVRSKEHANPWFQRSCTVAAGVCGAGP